MNTRYLAGAELLAFRLTTCTSFGPSDQVWPGVNVMGAPPLTCITIEPSSTSAQITRIASHRVSRSITPGEVFIEGGQTDVPFFVLKAGAIEVIRPSALGDLLVAVLRPAQFTGDVSMILGRPAQMRLSVGESGEVVQLTRDQMHALIQTDAEISEVLMRALIHRRIALVAQGVGDVLLIGSAQSAATVRIKAFLTRTITT